MKAPITLAIDALLADHIAPLLKAHGFRKKGQRFARVAGACVQLVELDRWKYNEGSHGRFGLTVGVFFPAVWQMVRQARPGWPCEPFDPRSPPVQNCVLDVPVLPPDGDPGLDSLWGLDASEPLDTVAQRVVHALEGFGLPWLQQHADLEATFDRLSELSRKGVWHASVHLLCAAALTHRPALAATALSAVLAAPPSRFFPPSERQAFQAIAASAAVASG